MYNIAYGSAPTYPIFYARHMSQFLTSPLLLIDLFLVSGVSNNTRFFILFANAMAVFVPPFPSSPPPLLPPFPSSPPSPPPHPPLLPPFPSLHTWRPAQEGGR